MTKRRSTWLGASGALFLILSLSGVAAGATPPDAVPDVVVDTTATFEDIDGNGIDDDCQDVAAVLDEEAAAAELLTVDTDGDGVISTTEAAHSPRIGGTNCNHGGYVSWIAHQDVTCVDEPTEEPVTEPAVDLIVAEDEDTDEEVAEPEDDACAADDSDAEAAKTEKTAAAALRAALKADRTLARETAKAERTAAREATKAERTSARDANKAERAAARAAAKAERAAAKAARKGN